MELESKAVLSHVIAAGPEILSPVWSNDDPSVVDPDDLAIEKGGNQTITEGEFVTLP